MYGRYKDTTVDIRVETIDDTIFYLFYLKKYVGTNKDILINACLLFIDLLVIRYVRKYKR